MKQYEVRWADMPEPIGRRPVLLLTRNDGYRYLSWVAAAAVTRTIRGIPQEVLLGDAEGLHVPSVANLDNVHSVRTADLGERLGRLSGDRAVEVKRALGRALGWPELADLPSDDT